MTATHLKSLRWWVGGEPQMQRTMRESWNDKAAVGMAKRLLALMIAAANAVEEQ